MSEVLVLVDFDNIEVGQSRLGLEYVGRKILSLCGNELAQNASRVRVRLYGGWYEKGLLTRNGQKLTGEIVSLSPITFLRGGRDSLIVNFELAKSLLADPSTLVDNTFRRREAQKNLRCKHPPWQGCANPANCSCVQFIRFFNTGCSAQGCTVKGAAVLERGEQKVVDSMLVVDLIYASQSGVQVVLVSRDDDMWPGLRLAACTGSGLVHLLTKSDSNLPSYYSSLRSGAYTCLSWR